MSISPIVVVVTMVVVVGAAVVVVVGARVVVVISAGFRKKGSNFKFSKILLLKNFRKKFLKLSETTTFIYGHIIFLGMKRNYEPKRR